MSSAIKKLLKDARREVTLPESGLEVRILRAKVYDFLKLSVPMGSLLQALSGAAWSFRMGKQIPDDTAARINAHTPSYADLCEKLLMECVFEIRDPNGPEGENHWERVKVVENDIVAGENEVCIDDFVRGFSLEDISELQSAVWEHNGLGKGVEAMLAPFREERQPADPPDGEELPPAADGDPGAGPGRVPVERGGDGGGGECGRGSEAEGDREGEAGRGAEVGS